MVSKPAGLLSVPGKGTDKSDSLATRVRNDFPDALNVHRLDMSTSGLLVFARGVGMHRQLSQLFRERKVNKSYLAMVAGRLDIASGVVDLPLSADWPNRPRQKVNLAIGKPALTRYRLLPDLNTHSHRAVHHGEPDLATSRVELHPVTGRTHQLRVHMAAIGHPILGDMLYGGAAGSRADRLLLHARQLSFVHPLGNETMTFICEAPF